MADRDGEQDDGAPRPKVALPDEPPALAIRDPYTVGAGPPRAPPVGLLQRVRYLGPSVVISGTIVGSGELILTSSLGAAAGMVALWWVLLSCWSKSLVQAELTRYVIASGDTYLRALNRLPGPRLRVGWPIWLGLLGFLPSIMSLGGILGGAGQALTLIAPELDSLWATALIAVATSLILYTGSYLRLERVAMVLVMAFTLGTLITAVTMQTTEFRISVEDLARGFTFEFPVEYLVLALAAYGYTGVNSGEVSAYTYWCVEKGYPSFIGDDRDDPRWPERARGWIRVVHLDVWVTLVILTCATVPFFLLGAGVLNTLDERPQGLETIAVLSNMFTRILGEWALWLFAGAAFCILFSSAVAGIGGGSRFLPDYLIELGVFERRNMGMRRAIIRVYGSLVPVLGFVFYLGVQNPVSLVSVGAFMAAIFLPVQSGATLWLQRARMDRRVAPSPGIRAALWLTFAFQAVMALLVIRFVVL